MAHDPLSEMAAMVFCRKVEQQQMPGVACLELRRPACTDADEAHLPTNHLQMLLTEESSVNQLEGEGVAVGWQR